MRSASVRVGLTRRRKSERKVTRMVVIIVLVFVLCWLPFFITNIVNLIHIIPENNTTAAVYFFLVILTYVNSCANPILYGFLSDNFKQSFQKVLCFHKPNDYGTTGWVGGGRSASQENHNPVLPRNPTQNGKIQCIQVLCKQYISLNCKANISHFTAGILKRRVETEGDTIIVL